MQNVNLFYDKMFKKYSDSLYEKLIIAGVKESIAHKVAYRGREITERYISSLSYSNDDVYNSLIQNGIDERSAYQIAYNVSEEEAAKQFETSGNQSSRNNSKVKVLTGSLGNIKMYEE